MSTKREVKSATQRAKKAHVEKPVPTVVNGVEVTNWPKDPDTAQRLAEHLAVMSERRRAQQRAVRADDRVAAARKALRVTRVGDKDYFRPDADRCMDAFYAIKRSAKFLPAVVGALDLAAHANVAAASEGRVLCSRHTVAPLMHVVAGMTRGEWEFRTQPIDYALASGQDKITMGTEAAVQVLVVAAEHGITAERLDDLMFREFREGLEKAAWPCMGAPHCDGDTSNVACVDVPVFCGLGIAVPGSAPLVGEAWASVPAVVQDLAKRDAAVRLLVQLVHLAGKRLPMSDGLVALTVALAGPKRWQRMPGHDRVAWADLNGRQALASVTGESAFGTPQARDLATWQALLGWVREQVGEDTRTAPVRTMLAGTAGFESPVPKTELQIIEERLRAMESKTNRTKDSGSFADPEVPIATPATVLRDSNTPRILAVLDGMTAPRQ